MWKLYRYAIDGENVGDLWDRMQDLRSALTPSAAYLEAPGLDGYLPFQFYVPTTNLADFASGYRQMQLNARPVRLANAVRELANVLTRIPNHATQ